MAKPGRPPVPAAEKIVTRSLGLSAAVDDAVCRYALRHNISVYRLLGQIVSRVFRKQINSASVLVVYRELEVRSSSVVAARRSSGVSSAGLV